MSEIKISIPRSNRKCSFRYFEHKQVLKPAVYKSNLVSHVINNIGFLST